MKHSKSSILLMEMVICIFFFALCAVISAQVFVQAHLLSEKTIRENHAIIVLESLSESFYASHGNINEIADSFPDYAHVDANNIILYFDEDYNYLTPNTISSDNCAFIASLKTSPDTSRGLINGSATFYFVDSSTTDIDSNKSIYNISLTVNDPAKINK